MSSFIKKFKDKKIVIRVLAIFALIFGISVLSDILQIKSDHYFFIFKFFNKTAHFIKKFKVFS